AAAAATAPQLGDAGAHAWLGFAYVSLFSMFLGFFAWYAGLARGGVARVGQIQLLQPLLTLSWSALILGEHVGAGMVVAATGTLACVLATQRARVRARVVQPVATPAPAAR
ncbi:MAG TPA: DMT family transporter, partial [Solirubrobacteraceae bacterium]|nr:DMT family transporter [Solirubrobacteraceae bacterium]